MKKTSSLLLAIMASFCFGFTLHTMIANKHDDPTKIGRVTGIRGHFLQV